MTTWSRSRVASPPRSITAPPGYKPLPEVDLHLHQPRQVCHGVPGDKRPLKKGDIVNLDITVIKDGFHGDTSRMFLVGGDNNCSKQASRLCAGHFRVPMARHLPRCALVHASGRHWPRHSATCRIEWLFGGSRVLRSWHRSATSTKIRRCFTTASRDTGLELQARHDLHHRADDECRKARRSRSFLTDGPSSRGTAALSAQWEHMILVTESGVEVLTLSANSPARPDIVANILP
jgi:methionyl aminopeptidase